MEINDFFEDSQKAYLKGLSGCIEHHATIEAVLENLASGKSNTNEVIIIMTDISNAFGSVKHSDIVKALELYSFPKWFIEIVGDLYRDLFIKITDSKGKENFIRQLIGVFQGDPLSAVLFIIVMNMALQTVNNKKFVEKHGVCMYPASLYPDNKVSNMGFSDDIGLITKSKESAIKGMENLEKFSINTGMNFAFKKFVAIGFRRSVNSFTMANSKIERRIESFDPEIDYKGQRLHSATEIGSFKVLGKTINVNLAAKESEKRLMDKVEFILGKIDKAVVTNSIKLEIFKVAFESKLTWDLTTNTVSETYIKTTILTKVNKMIRKWLHLPPGATEKMFYLSYKLGGMNLPNVHTLWKKTLISKTLQLQQSVFPKTRNLIAHRESKFKGNSFNPFKEIKKLKCEMEKLIAQKKLKRPKSKKHERSKLLNILKKNCLNTIFQNAKELESSGSGYREIDGDTNTAPAISVLWGISNVLATEASKLLADNLLNNSKIAKYAKNINLGKCKCCNCENQTVTHILTNCSIAAKIDTNDPRNRQSWRHNCVLKYITDEVKGYLVDQETRIYVDLPQNENSYKEFPSDLLSGNTSLRPDIIIQGKNSIVIGELTCPMESNMKKNNVMKTKKYTDVLLPVMKNDIPVVISAFEVSARGVVGESLRKFLDQACFKFPKGGVKNQIMKNASTIAVMCSLDLYKYRNNKEWIPKSPKDMEFPIKMSGQVEIVNALG
jgi:hypothetical protein